jgi:hypothetical protein
MSYQLPESTWRTGAPVYESIPVNVEAIEYTGGEKSAEIIIGWVQKNGGNAVFYPTQGARHIWDEERRAIVDYDPTPEAFVIATLEGDMKCSPGDFVIRGTEGEFYPCKPSVMARKYRRVL